MTDKKRVVAYVSSSNDLYLRAHLNSGSSVIDKAITAERSTIGGLTLEQLKKALPALTKRYGTQMKLKEVLRHEATQWTK